MQGSEFIATYTKSSLAAWELAAIEQAEQENLVPWPMVPIPVSSNGHTGTFFVTSDYLAIGTLDDYVRMPLTPATAQAIADMKNLLLPTAKMVEDIWKHSPIKLVPENLSPNKGANLAQYAQHSRLVDSSLQRANAFPGSLTSGQKKDVIISGPYSPSNRNGWKPGKVVIYGWYRPNGSPIQPKSNIHGDFYVDYSHGIRLVSPNMEVDGRNVTTEEVLQDPELSGLLTNEGPIVNVRYPSLSSRRYLATNSYYDIGNHILLSEVGRNAA